mmetsp:Transcript_45291/g.142019  ORF Transcript_45291/g.142019 Transcript_45291/m.142019 type:complete len:228 (-) Transcript_45291:2-685(-)
MNARLKLFRLMFPANAAARRMMSLLSLLFKFLFLGGVELSPARLRASRSRKRPKATNCCNPVTRNDAGMPCKPGAISTPDIVNFMKRFRAAWNAAYANTRPVCPSAPDRWATALLEEPPQASLRRHRLERPAGRAPASSPRERASCSEGRHEWVTCGRHEEPAKPETPCPMAVGTASAAARHAVPCTMRRRRHRRNLAPAVCSRQSAMPACATGNGGAAVEGKNSCT